MPPTSTMKPNPKMYGVLLDFESEDSTIGFEESLVEAGVSSVLTGSDVFAGSSVLAGSVEVVEVGESVVAAGSVFAGS